MSDYSTKAISDKLLNEIKESLSKLDFGSIEIYVNNGEVNQITTRYIKKTSNTI